MKRFLTIALAAILIFSISSLDYDTARADDADNGEDVSVEKMIEELELSGINELFSQLDDEQKQIFGGDIIKFIKNVASGQDALSADGFINYLLSQTGSALLEFLPLMFSILAIVVAVQLLSGLRGSFASESMENVFAFSSALLCASVVFVQIFLVVKQGIALISTLTRQMDVVFPILFTLMTALGAHGSIAIYQPAVAILAYVITKLITTVVFPLILIVMVFSVVSCLSNVVKLDGINKFFISLTKWIMYSSFFIFLAFLSLKGVTAAVYDNMSVRTAKFALSKYIPVIGGYLSEGLNVVLAGTVLIKNAVGFSAIVLLFVTVLPTLLAVIFLMLTLKLTAGVCQMIGNDKISSLLTSVSGSLNLLIAVLFGVVFLYFIFLMLLILSGNLVL